MVVYRLVRRHLDRMYTARYSRMRSRIWRPAILMLGSHQVGENDAKGNSCVLLPSAIAVRRRYEVVLLLGPVCTKDQLESLLLQAAYRRNCRLATQTLAEHSNAHPSNWHDYL